MLRQTGIENRLITLASQITQLLTPGIPLSDKAREIARLNALATTQTKDSGLVPVTFGNTFIFPHNLGYTPSVTLIVAHHQPSDFPYISAIDDNTVTIACASNNLNPTLIRVICH